MSNLGRRLAFHGVILGFDLVEGFFDLGGIVNCCAEPGVSFGRLLKIWGSMNSEEGFGRGDGVGGHFALGIGSGSLHGRGVILEGNSRVLELVAAGGREFGSVNKLLIVDDCRDGSGGLELLRGRGNVARFTLGNIGGGGVVADLGQSGWGGRLTAGSRAPDVLRVTRRQSRRSAGWDVHKTSTNEAGGEALGFGVTLLFHFLGGGLDTLPRSDDRIVDLVNLDVLFLFINVVVGLLVGLLYLAARRELVVLALELIFVIIDRYCIPAGRILRPVH
jgi:hypothetical protein